MMTTTPATITLPTDEQIRIDCHLDAPRHLVYRAWTTPELVKRWWAGQRGVMTVADIDLRVGGAWRYVLVTGDGIEVAFHGVYREIVPEERIVGTEVFEMPGAGAGALPLPPELEPVSTVEFVDGPAGVGGTSLVIVSQLPSREMRDMILASGMEGGMQEQMVCLAEVAGGLA
jgi:uncharacterized protein YndB with AHSA1/START domain